MNSSKINNIYLQRQHKSNLCRMYSINNYFGYEKISEKDFENYCKKYDEFIKGLNTYNNDGFSEGRCLTSYIIELLDNKFCFLIPINSYDNSRNHIDIDYYKKKMKYIEDYFEFNKNHIWIKVVVEKLLSLHCALCLCLHALVPYTLGKNICF